PLLHLGENERAIGDDALVGCPVPGERDHIKIPHLGLDLPSTILVAITVIRGPQTADQSHYSIHLQRPRRNLECLTAKVLPLPRLDVVERGGRQIDPQKLLDRKSTRLNSSHVKIAYAVYCLKKKI